MYRLIESRKPCNLLKIIKYLSTELLDKFSLVESLYLAELLSDLFLADLSNGVSYM